MRRVIFNLLQCPQCRRGALLPDADTAELTFGPLRCGHCRAAFPVAEGVADLGMDRAHIPLFQRGLERAFVARSYERYVRPVIQNTLIGLRFDRDSEFLLYRALLGQPSGPVLDIGTGTGLFARRLARDPLLPPIVGMDVSKAMIEEGVAQARESGVMVDFVRAEAPYLPFQDQSLGAVLQSGSLPFISNISRLLMEVGRVLKPGGRFIATTSQPPGIVSTLVHRRLGLHPRSEHELRSAIAAAGLVNFERLTLPPFLLVKAERAGKGAAGQRV